MGRENKHDRSFRIYFKGAITANVSSLEMKDELRLSCKCDYTVEMSGFG